MKKLGKHHSHPATSNNTHIFCFLTCCSHSEKSANLNCALDPRLLLMHSPTSSLLSFFKSHFLWITPISLQAYCYFSHFKQWQQISLVIPFFVSLCRKLFKRITYHIPKSSRRISDLILCDQSAAYALVSCHLLLGFGMPFWLKSFSYLTGCFSVSSAASPSPLSLHIRGCIHFSNNKLSQVWWLKQYVLQF